LPKKKSAANRFISAVDGFDALAKKSPTTTPINHILGSTINYGHVLDG